ncbi:hypothetical protein MtrunA17_Chr5g0432021 [Medicago truncatula]|uniref:Transmembrane protein n=1 Tax=Medicago truncatula TaxID=3880 RepID=A0A396I1F9_MEDTR|nr:hypothetical protein MtrunA17_Chr5g0432021 [Medicago truncatula]
MLCCKLFLQPSIWKLELVEDYSLHCFQFHYLSCNHFCKQMAELAKFPAHSLFRISIFTITFVYSFFFDKDNGKPDVYSLVSGAAFAIMSLGLSKQSHFGFEIKLFLVIAGAIFSYPLIFLRFYLDAPTKYSEELTNTADYHVVQVDGSQVNSDCLVAPDLTFDVLPENGDIGL